MTDLRHASAASATSIRADRRVFASILLVIFGVELFVHMALGALPRMSPLALDFVDALSLTILGAPLLWFIIAKPLRLGAEVQRLRLEARVATELRSCSDGILTTDARGTISHVNAGAERLFDYTASEVVGQHVNVLLPARAHRSHEQHLARVAAGPDGSRAMGLDVLVEGRRKNGELFPAEVTISKRGEGEDTVLTAVVRDATERRRMEEGLRLFRALLDRSSDMILVVDPNTGRFLDMNQKTCVDLGYSREEMLTMSVFDVDPMLDRASFSRNAAALRKTGVLLREGLRRRKDGSTFPVEDSISRIELDREYNVAVARDITERKRAEGDLRLQSAALNVSAIPKFITDREGTVVWVNLAFTKSTGYSAEDAVGKNPRALFRSGVHDRAFYKRLWDTILAGHAWRGEMTNRRKDGSLYPELQTITPVRDAQGEITHFISVKQDLTEQKQLQAQFLQAQKMESVARLAGGVAHDFNNLLSVVIGWTGMALEDLPAGHPVRPSLEEVLSAGQRGAVLTLQLLAFSRQQVVEPVLFNVNVLVVEMDKMLGPLLGEDIKLAIRADPGLGTVRMDRGQLEQVLMNLAVNARDAMPGGGTLTIETANVVLGGEDPRTHADVTPGDYVLLAVSDTGTGMSEKVKAHLFEPFFTTKAPGKGTGLGLATCYGIVKQAGGHISVDSEEGVGTTVSVYLARTLETPEAVVRPLRKTPTHGAETILLVEDDDAVRRVIERMLATQGYRVVSTNSGEDALRMIADGRESPHLLLTDVVLSGGMSGPVLAERVRALRPDQKVLFASGYTSDVTILHGLLQHGITLLQKPFTADSLGEKVRHVLDTG